ncbi:MAG: MerR family transcriptional regulator [Betaproteobacteria bacterium]
MFRIGDFSRIARVSARLLRFYDEIGLFAPAHADPHTGYRFYTVNQLAELNRITVLKDLGFSLEQVRDILKSRIDAAELRSMLLLRRSDAARALATEELRLRQIETRIAQIETEGQLSSDDVVVRAEPERRILSFRTTVPSFAAARDMIGQLRILTKPLLPKRHDAQLVVVAHAAQFEGDELDLEFGFALDENDLTPLPADTTLSIVKLPAVPRMAVCVRMGPPDVAHLVTARIGHFLAQSGEMLDGPGREAFLVLPAQDRMQDSVVEMQFPIRVQAA